MRSPLWPLVCRRLLICSRLLISCCLIGAALARSMTPVCATEAPRPGEIEIRNGAKPGSLEIRSDGTVDLAPDLIVERQRDDGVFEPLQHLDLSAMKLVTSCRQQLGACVRVDARGLRPLAWTGMSCASQCNHTCDKNVRLFGRFRFVVTSCDGKTRFEGPVFELAR